MNSEKRAGNFTSSEIVNLVAMGKRPMTDEELAARPKKGKGSSTTQVDDTSKFTTAGLTYIADKNLERRLGRSLHTETTSRPTDWGKLLEIYVLEHILGMEYKPISSETVSHPDISFWAGSPDARKFDDGGTVIELKCPHSLKSYCTFADCSTMDEIREKHPDGESYYWQTVSNAILLNARYAEFICFCPYKSEIPALRELTQSLDTDEQSKYSWVYWAHSDDLPYLPDGGYYKNLHIIRFEVPEADKQLLIGRVLQAGNLLVERYEIQNAEAA